MAALKALVFIRKVSTENLIDRDAMKRVRRIAAMESLDLLPQEQLDKRILAAFIQSLDAISPGSVVELSGEKG
jgi:hypothetical protein